MLDKIKEFLASLGGNGARGRGDTGGGPEMISCDEALEYLFEYLDGELEDPTEEQVARHFDICRRCFPRLNFEKAFRDALRQVRRGERAPERVKQQVHQLLSQEGLDTP